VPISIQSRCFPSYGRIAAAAKCHRDTVCVAIRALEDAGILTWVHRIARIRRRERDLFGQLVKVIRTSNAYRFVDPLTRDPGRKGYKSENPAGPQNRDLKKKGARLDGARFMQEEPSQAPPVSTEPPEVAPQREHASGVRVRLSPAERAALVARLDTNPTQADWLAWEREPEAMVARTIG
jgi:hypothetical protein